MAGDLTDPDMMVGETMDGDMEIMMIIGVVMIDIGIEMTGMCSLHSTIFQGNDMTGALPASIHFLSTHLNLTFLKAEILNFLVVVCAEFINKIETRKKLQLQFTKNN